MKPLRLLLPLALMASLAACATPSAIPRQAGIAGPVLQETPETMAQWKVLADRLAVQAAPHLVGVAVSPRAQGLSSAFDVVFHDFFVSALHAQGVAVADGGARVEIATYPLAFPAHPHYIKAADGRTGAAPPLELGVNVRIFDGARMAFAGSQAYYLPAGDLGNYQPLLRSTRPLRVVGE